MRVCFVALNALPMIDPGVAGPIGGIETRAWMLARALAKRPDWRVTFVVRHHAPPPQSAYEGVDLVPLIDPLYPLWQDVGRRVRRSRRFPWIDIRAWNANLLWQLPRLALDRLVRGRVYAADVADPRLVGIEADVYVTFGVQTHSAVVIRSAHAAGRPAVLVLGSDGDLDPIFECGGTGSDPYGTRAEAGRFILSAADHIVAQTAEQQQRVRSAFGRDAWLLANPIDVERWDAGRAASLSRELTRELERYILWVGRAELTHKRPQLCLDIAARCPEARFLMILNPSDPEVFHRIRADAPGNIHIVERVPFPQMPAVFFNAAALLSTSRLEGFPNVFLQAALSGVPILSLEVGRPFLESSRGGVCTGGDLDALAARVRDAWIGSPLESVDASTARRFVIENHALAAQVDRLGELLASAARQELAPAGS